MSSNAASRPQKHAIHVRRSEGRCHRYLRAADKAGHEMKNLTTMRRTQNWRRRITRVSCRRWRSVFTHYGVYHCQSVVAGRRQDPSMVGPTQRGESRHRGDGPCGWRSKCRTSPIQSERLPPLKPCTGGDGQMSADLRLTASWQACTFLGETLKGVGKHHGVSTKNVRDA